MRALELSGKKVGRLTVLCRVGSRSGASLWLCRCECGNTAEVVGEKIKAGAIKSCGCLRVEAIRAVATTHGLTGTPEHIAWKAMHLRCFNPKHDAYPYYGGRGITVDPAWRGDDGFAAFLVEMGPKPSIAHTLDRIDPDRNYEPGNCRWATWHEQRINRRETSSKGVSQ